MHVPLPTSYMPRLAHNVVAFPLTPKVHAARPETTCVCVCVCAFARQLAQHRTLWRAAGLSAKATFLVLQTLGPSCVNPLQRATYEDGK